MAMNPKDEKKHNPYNILKNPMRWYAWRLDASITANEPDVIIRMDVPINKGEKEGAAIIPCSLYTVSHGIDLNPSLLKKNTGEVKEIPQKEAEDGFAYDPAKELLVLQENEKITSQRDLNPSDDEYLACGKCGQKVTVAQVRQTRYRSCPKVEVELSSPAPENLLIPMQFGVNRDDIKRSIRWRGITGFLLGTYAFLAVLIYSPLVFPNGVPLISPAWAWVTAHLSGVNQAILASNAGSMWIERFIYGLFIPGFLAFGVIEAFVPLAYGMWSTGRWWHLVEKSAVPYDERNIKVFEPKPFVSPDRGGL